MGNSLQRKGLIAIVMILAAILVIASSIFFGTEEGEIEVPEPGHINFTFFSYNESSYNFTVRFGQDAINVTSSVVEWGTYEQVFSISKEYNISRGEEIWYPLVKGCLKMKSYIPKIDCLCIPSNSIELIDEKGDVIVYGYYNSHKFNVFVQGAYSIIPNGKGDIKRGYQLLDAFSNMVYNDLRFELSKYKDFIFLPENEPALQRDDDQYFAVGGGGTGTHALLVTDFKCPDAKGDLESIRLKIRYKTNEDYSNDNTLKIIYNGTMDTGIRFNSSVEEVDVIVDASNKFDLESVNIEDISLYYENHGGFIPTPVIYFEYTLIEVTNYNP